jgi:hypothetical protein
MNGGAAEQPHFTTPLVLCKQGVQLVRVTEQALPHFTKQHNSFLFLFIID